MSKFFVESNQVNDNQIKIVGEDVNHIKNVLRLTINDEIKIMNPIMRKMNINSTKNNGNNNRTKKENNINICQCRKNFEKLKSLLMRLRNLGT